MEINTVWKQFENKYDFGGDGKEGKSEGHSETAQENNITTQEDNKTTQETEKTTQETKDTTQGTILKLIKNMPEITQKELAEQIGISLDGVKYHIQKMRRQGLIRHEGATKSGRWVILK